MHICPACTCADWAVCACARLSVKLNANVFPSSPLSRCYVPSTSLAQLWRWTPMERGFLSLIPCDLLFIKLKLCVRKHNLFPPWCGYCSTSPLSCISASQFACRSPPGPLPLASDGYICVEGVCAQELFVWILFFKKKDLTKINFWFIYYFLSFFSTGVNKGASAAD